MKKQKNYKKVPLILKILFYFYVKKYGVKYCLQYINTSSNINESNRVLFRRYINNKYVIEKVV